jgi:hypothetical protein
MNIHNKNDRPLKIKFWQPRRLGLPGNSLLMHSFFGGKGELLGFELMALHLLGRHSITLAMLLAQQLANNQTEEVELRPLNFWSSLLSISYPNNSSPHPSIFKI